MHGYDLLNVVFIDPLRFASIADEKVLRVFDAPRTYVELAETLRVAHFDKKEVSASLHHNVSVIFTGFSMIGPLARMYLRLDYLTRLSMTVISIDIACYG